MNAIRIGNAHYLVRSREALGPGVNCLSLIDASSAEEAAFVDDLKSMERVKSYRPEAFEGMCLMIRGGLPTQFETQWEPRWKGSRVYQIAGSKGNSGVLNSTVIEHAGSTEPPSVEQLGDFLGKHMSRYRINIVCISGHGDGKHVARMSLAGLAEALDVASAMSGLKPAILLLNACSMGSLDTMGWLQQRAGVAIASEGILPNQGFPIRKMLIRACEEQSADPHHVALAMIPGPEESWGFLGETMSVVDLDKVGPLKEAVKRLIGSIWGELVDGPRSGGANQELWKILNVLRGRRTRSVNLGAFLEKLQGQQFPNLVRSTARDASERLGESLIALWRNPGSHGSDTLSGLSM